MLSHVLNSRPSRIVHSPFDKSSESTLSPSLLLIFQLPKLTQLICLIINHYSLNWKNGPLLKKLV